MRLGQGRVGRAHEPLPGTTGASGPRETTDRPSPVLVKDMVPPRGPRYCRQCGDPLILDIRETDPPFDPMTGERREVEYGKCPFRERYSLHDWVPLQDATLYGLHP